MPFELGTSSSINFSQDLSLIKRSCHKKKTSFVGQRGLEMVARMDPLLEANTVIFIFSSGLLSLENSLVCKLTMIGACYYYIKMI